MKGDFVLIDFTYTNLAGSKLRPALVIHEKLKDVVAVFVSSQVQPFNPYTDVLVDSNHPEYKMTGLKVNSLIELDKIMTIEKTKVAGGIGTAGNKIKTEFNAKFFGIYRL